MAENINSVRSSVGIHAMPRVSVLATEGNLCEDKGAMRRTEKQEKNEKEDDFVSRNHGFTPNYYLPSSDPEWMLAT